MESSSTESTAVERDLREFLAANYFLGDDPSQLAGVELADRGRPDRLDRRARARRLPRGAVRHPDHERGAPAGEPRLDRQHRRASSRGSAARAGQLDDGQGHAGRPRRSIRSSVAEEIAESLRRRRVPRAAPAQGRVVGVSGGIDSSRHGRPVRARARAGAHARAAHARGRLGPRHARHQPAGRRRVRRRDGRRGHHADPRATGCYERREEAVRERHPAVRRRLAVQDRPPERRRRRAATGSSRSSRSPRTARRSRRGCRRSSTATIVAATNFKQRTRKMLEYFHADRLNYAVIGTPNRLEYDQGFFVKLGDGAADVEADRAPLQEPGVPARGVPRRARARSSSGRRRRTRTRCRRARRSSTSRCPTRAWTSACTRTTTGLPPEAVADAVWLTPEQVQRVYDDIDQKRRTTRYLHLAPQLVEPVFGD